MKFYKLLTVIAMLIIMGSVVAKAATGLSENQRVLGYTVTDDINYSGALFGEAGTYTIGALLPAKQFENYRGCKIVGMRVASALILGRTRMLLTEISDDKVETVHEQKQRLTPGWNNIFFNGLDYVIDGEKDIFFGFDYVETEEMINNRKGGVCSVGSDTPYSFMLYEDNEFIEVGGVGMLCIQLIVDITNMPNEHTTMSFFDHGFKYKQAGDSLEVFAIVNNVGKVNITSLNMACRIDNNEPITIPVNCNIATGGSYTVEEKFPLEGYTAGGHHVYLYVDRINGKEYTQGPDRGRGADFAIYENSISRNAVLAEVYMDQNNPNSPGINKGIEMAKQTMGDEMIVVNTFRPGNPLGVPDCLYLHNLYAYTLPSFTSNRFHFPGENFVAYDVNDYLGIFDSSFISALFESIFEQDLTTPSFGDIKIVGNVNGDRVLTVKATGRLLPEAQAIFGDIALTIMVTEDNVTAAQNIDGSRGTYTYNDVMRGYMTAPTGKVLTPATSGSYEETFTVNIPSGINVDNINVVALLTMAGTPTEETLYDYDVINAAKAKVTNDAAGIENVIVDDRANDGNYYNLQGIMVTNPQPGNIYIHNGRKVIQ